MSETPESEVIVALDQKVEIARRQLELAELRQRAAAIAAPWWRQAHTVTVLTTIVASVWPLTTLISGRMDKAKADAAEDRKWSEAVRTSYLERIKPSPESDAELKNPLLLSRRHLGEWRGYLITLRFVVGTSPDKNLVRWAQEEKEILGRAISSEEEAQKNEEKGTHTEIASVAKLDEAERLKPLSTSGSDSPADQQRREKAKQLVAEAKKLRAQAAQDYQKAAAERAKVELPLAPSAAVASNAHPGILWVDDNPANNKDLSDVLQSAGASVFISTSNNDAERKIEQNPAGYDLIISDMGRPGEHITHAAYELTSWLNEKSIHIPVIVYSGGSSAPDKQKEAYDHHAEGSTDRPSELFQLIQKVLRNFRITPRVNGQ
jgi:CheY-like chemotaxis protein